MCGGMTLPPAVVLIVPDGIGPSLDSLHRMGRLTFEESIRCPARSASCRDARDRTCRTSRSRTEDRACDDRTPASGTTVSDRGRSTGGTRSRNTKSAWRVPTASWDMVDEQFRTAALEVERARQNHDATAAEVAGCRDATRSSPRSSPRRPPLVARSGTSA